jgi:hypothetical protein
MPSWRSRASSCSAQKGRRIIGRLEAVFGLAEPRQFAGDE